MKTPLLNTNTITKEHPFPGTTEFHLIDRITFGAGHEGMTITPSATIGKKFPFCLNNSHQIFFFPDDHNPAQYIYGKIHKNGILLLKFTFKDGNTRKITITPPYTVYWATNNETPGATRGKIIRGKA